MVGKPEKLSLKYYINRVPEEKINKIICYFKPEFNLYFRTYKKISITILANDKNVFATVFVQNRNNSLRICCTKTEANTFSFATQKASIGSKPNKKKKLLLSPAFRIASKANQGVHTLSLICRQFSDIYKNSFI